jgi:hypothetical protein
MTWSDLTFQNLPREAKGSSARSSSWQFRRQRDRNRIHELSRLLSRMMIAMPGVRLKSWPEALHQRRYIKDVWNGMESLPWQL